MGLKHLSIRVPWHDTGWEGTVCQNPNLNSSCLILDRLAPKKDDGADYCLDYEVTKHPNYRKLRNQKNAGKCLDELEDKQYPACVSERMAFMSPFEYNLTIKYPYTYRPKLSHFLPTKISNPPYSASTIPFYWLSKKGIKSLLESNTLPVSMENEKDFEKDNEIRTDWANVYNNQKLIIDWFYSQIKPEKSLCFFYAKKVPFVEEQNRIIIGVGRVKQIDDYREYDYKEDREYRGLIWERMVHHSIRPDFDDGFILPYHAAIKFADENPDIEFDPTELAVYPPKGKIREFSYVTEHVSNDSAIDVMLSCAESLKKAIKIGLKGPWKKSLNWINLQIGELWKMRGPYPGMGSALTALGFSLGNFIALEIDDQLKEDENPWIILEASFENPDDYFSNELAGELKGMKDVWEILTNDEKDLLQLISRFDLSPLQAKMILMPETRDEFGLNFDENEVLENPYLIFEQTHHTVEPISFLTIDHGVLPCHEIANKFPLPDKSKIESELDWRRIRALISEILEEATYEGHSLLPQNLIIEKSKELQLDPPCNLNGKIILAKEKYFLEVIEKIEMEDGKPAYQLTEIYKNANFIKNKLLSRKEGKRNLSNIEWEKLLFNYLEKKYPLEKSKDPEAEKKARDEKSAALREIAESRLSVLIGSAGTGKTTLLSILCQEPEIRERGILLLAPTGKARVKMEQALGLSSRKDPKIKAYNIAQFLVKSSRYNGETGRFFLNDEPPKRVGETVIVDEASMLTEEMLASLLQSIKGYKRLILVGDRYQLPPIGTGRPFVDIITEFKPETLDDNQFPKVGDSYAELTINRRQTLEECGKRYDIQLANWFRGGSLLSTDDMIFDLLNGLKKSDCLKIYQWDSPDEFSHLLFEILKNELNLKTNNDYKTFNNSLGAVNGIFKVGAAKKAEKWQILSPVRNRNHGVSEINRAIHQKFKTAYIRSARSRENKLKRYDDYTKKAKPAGPEEIVWGDKVINIQNQSIGTWNINNKKQEDGYLANGEIGIFVEKSPINNKDFALKFEFSSQLGLEYSFFESLTPMNSKYRFKNIDEDQPSLELAYALTVHKAQGSEFGKVILVIPRNSFNISRELIYTALTRQQDGIIILFEGNPIDLMNYSEEKWSETNQRFTNLFRAPCPREVKDKKDLFLEDRLINRTLRGEDVRSKSELIIANILYHYGIDYEYEGVLEFDGEVRRPDFIIEDDDSGEFYYWEHLGMLNNLRYKQNWEKKKEWYYKNGITVEGGRNGTLIISVDNKKGGIYSEEIENILKKHSLI
ncbi:AAA family ATPase [Methanobacterium sp. BAmetb5]|uniref:AAA family ATPase n=1 Tax=Methanobacterium sp. BAmetb5 TaxID=2025351 RepID=UPI000E7F58ED|nr:AAA family ATPase [Methanobacterium sp. BAmetb5]AXV39097.1 MAG: hypothetical protein CIT02_01590 [Methanobacterium sp. BAmetb5]